MTFSYVLVETAPAKEREVYKKLLGDKKVVEATPLFGEWDIILKVQGENFDAIKEYVNEVLKQTQGVVDTKTLDVIK